MQETGQEDKRQLADVVAERIERLIVDGVSSRDRRCRQSGV